MDRNEGKGQVKECPAAAGVENVVNFLGCTEED